MKHFDQGLDIVGVLVSAESLDAESSEVLVDDIHASVAPLGKETLSVRKAEVVFPSVHIRLYWPHSVWNPYAEDSAWFENT